MYSLLILPIYDERIINFLRKKYFKFASYEEGIFAIFLNLRNQLKMLVFIATDDLQIGSNRFTFCSWFG